MDDTFLRKFFGFTCNSLETKAQEANLYYFCLYFDNYIFLCSIFMEIKILLIMRGIYLSGGDRVEI